MDRKSITILQVLICQTFLFWLIILHCLTTTENEADSFIKWLLFYKQFNFYTSSMHKKWTQTHLTLILPLSWLSHQTQNKPTDVLIGGGWEKSFLAVETLSLVCIKGQNMSCEPCIQVSALQSWDGKMYRKDMTE